MDNKLLLLLNRFSPGRRLTRQLSYASFAIVFLLSLVKPSEAKAANYGKNKINHIEKNDILISGKVTSGTDGETLIGVSVKVKGTSVGTTTDQNGIFSIKAPENGVLVISYIGFETLEVPVNNRTSLNIVLQPASKNLEEVVVVGYGTQRKKDVTGSVVSVQTEDLPQVANASVNNLLQGRAAGLNLDQRSAQPGGGLTVNLRGGGTPLYVIDGVPLFNNKAPEPGIKDGDLGYSGGIDRDPLSSINPADIESIDVLKDASAAAIYGSAAAHGVILITTKKGKAGKINTEYRASYTAQSPKDYFPFLDAKGFMQEQVRLSRDKFLFDKKLAPYGNQTTTDVFTPLFTQSQIDAAGQGTDWLGMLIRDGNINEHNITVSGGTDKTRIYTSFNYYGNKAVIANSDFDRYTGRINLQQDLSDRFKLSLNLTLSQINSNNAASGSNSGGQEKYNEIQAAYAFVPTVDVFDASGNYSRSLNRLITNPAAFFIMTDKLRTNRFFAAPNLEVKIIDGLKFNLSGGIDKQSSKRNFFLPRKVQNSQLPDGMGQLSTNSTGNYTSEGYLTYNKSIGDHAFTVVGGAGYYKNDSESFGLQAVGFFTDALNVNDVSIASNKDRSFVNSFKGEGIKMSQFGRINYSYNSKYILTFNIRRDGSSSFAPNKKWGVFPGISAGWQISEESFLANSKVISNLKLRAGFGTVGNDANLNALALYGLGGGSFLFGNTLYPSVALTQLANDDLSWETHKSTNIGLDWALFNNRISGAIDLFRRDATDYIRYVPLPYNNAVSRLQTNLGGDTRSQGIEFSLNSKNTAGIVKWETSFNLSKYANRWLERSPYDVLNSYQKKDDRLDVVYGWKTNGIVNAANEIPSYMPNATLGNVIYVDQNNDGKLDAADVVELGNRDPKWIFGLGNTLNFKNFDLNVFVYGRFNQYMNNNYSAFYGADRIGVPDAQNTLIGISDVYSADRPNGSLPGIAANPYAGSNPTGTTDLYQQDVSYLRIRNVSLGYTISPKKMIRSARLFVDLQNLGVITNYKGYDPELTEANPYPQARATTFGVNVNF